ncbi:MAG: type II toxin-antitoxin system VapB family antitoxin [Acidobacteria bacterium]|nr:type II toxin-antitoxin system VapB family antitoxin [Acidobacteriota bacterium]
MGLNIRNAEVERLAAEVAAMARESKTEAIRIALLERKERLSAPGGELGRRAKVMQYLQRSVWPNIRPESLGTRVPKKEMDDLFGL